MKYIINKFNLIKIEIENDKDYQEYMSKSLDLVIPEGVEQLDDKLFQRSKISFANVKKLTIPKSLWKIGRNTFNIGDEELSLEKITIHKENRRFQQVENCLITNGRKRLYIAVKNAVLPSNIWHISPSALYYDKENFNLVIPKGVKLIENNAIKSKYSINVELPETITYMGETALNFNLKGLTLNQKKKNPYLFMEDGCLYKKCKDELLMYNYAYHPQFIENKKVLLFVQNVNAKNLHDKISKMFFDDEKITNDSIPINKTTAEKEQILQTFCKEKMVSEKDDINKDGKVMGKCYTPDWLYYYNC